MSKQIEINPYINQPVDKKSKQVVIKELMMAQLGVTKLKKTEAFNEPTAHTLVESHLKKKAKPSMVLFLVDRIRFTKKGKHEYLSYREIHNMLRFPQRPHVFMFFVCEEKKNTKTYETYACTNPEDVQTIREIITTAQHDPKRLLQHIGATRMISISSSSSSEYYIEERANNRVYSRPSSATYYQRAPVEYVYAVEPEQPVVYQKMYTRPRGSVARTSTAPSGDVTYLRSDNINGPQIMERGPVYMYVQRSKPGSRNEDYSPEFSPRI